MDVSAVFGKLEEKNAPPGAPTPPPVVELKPWSALDNLEPEEFERMKRQKQTFEIHKTINDSQSTNDSTLQTLKKLVTSEKYYLEGKLYFNTALTLAFKEFRYDIVDVLLEAGADVNNTPNLALLHLMVTRRQDEPDCIKWISKCIVKYGAKVDITDKENRTPLHYASYMEFLDVVELLISEGADVNAVDYCHFTPLHCAVQTGKLDIVRYLVSHGAYVNMCNVFGWSPLFYCFQSLTSKVHLTISNVLLEAGANAGHRDSNLNTAMHILLSCEDKALIGNVNFDVDALERHHVFHPKIMPETIFSLSRSQTLIEYLKPLLNWGCDPNAANKYQDTALILAVRHQEYKAARFVILCGASRQFLKHHVCAPQRTIFDNRQARQHNLAKDLSGFFDLSEPLKLQECCRMVIRKSLVSNIRRKSDELLLPKMIALFLNFDL